jgi:hypothetical protein
VFVCVGLETCQRHRLFAVVYNFVCKQKPVPQRCKIQPYAMPHPALKYSSSNTIIIIVIVTVTQTGCMVSSQWVESTKIQTTKLVD